MSTSVPPTCIAQPLRGSRTENDRAPIPAIQEIATRFYHPELDGLRFLAFLAVFFYHALSSTTGIDPLLGNSLKAWIFTAIHAGQVGVDVFFVLSSYLITELLVREWQARGTIAIGPFFARRCLRIWPLYYFYLALTILLHSWLMPQAGQDPHLTRYLLMVANWPAPAGSRTSYWDVIHLWTISLEEQFYLVVPLIIKLISPRRLMAAAVACLILIGAGRVYLALEGSPAQQVEFNTVFRLDSFAVGTIIALALRGHAPALTPATRRAMTIGGAALILVAVKTLKVGSPVAWHAALYYPAIAVSAGILLLAALQPQGRATGVWARPLFVKWGRISYGLYVYHMLALLAVAQVRLFPGGLLGVVARTSCTLGLTIIIASISYRWLELPFLKLKQRFACIQSRPVAG